MKKYYLLSLKHTHKNDVWLTFERVNNRGYCWFKDWAFCGELNPDEEYRNDSSKPVQEELIANLWEKVIYEDDEHFVIFNTPENRVMLNINQSQLNAAWPTPVEFTKI